VAAYKKIVDIVDVKKNLEQYYGIEQKSYNVILAPLIQAGGYGIKIEDEEELDDIYCIMGPIDMNNNNLLFYIEDLPKYIEYHEFSHSFINPLVFKDRDKINKNYKLAKLFKEVQSDMQKNSIGTVETFLDEYIVRTAVARLINKYEGEDYYRRVIELEKENGFIYIEELCNSLENYENNRDKYPTFESYYDEIIKCLSNIETE
jgi:hypothetical protein